MTKISVNKIPFDGPKTHNEILEKIRTDLVRTQNRLAIGKIAFIVSSFFRNDVLFADVPKGKTIKVRYVGKLYPGRMPVKIKRVRAANKRRYNAVKKFLELKMKRIAVYQKQNMILKYNRWAEDREKEKLPYVSMEMYMFYRHLEFPDVRPVTKEQIKRNLFRFNDEGIMVIKRKSPEMKRYFAEKNAKENAQKSLQIGK